MIDRERAQTDYPGRSPARDLRALGTDSETGLIEQYAYDLGVTLSSGTVETDGSWSPERTSAPPAFVPDRLAGERLEFGQRATIDQLARDIVAELQRMVIVCTGVPLWGLESRDSPACTEFVNPRARKTNKQHADAYRTPQHPLESLEHGSQYA